MSKVLVFCEKDGVAFEILSACSGMENVYAAVLGPGAKERTKNYAPYVPKTVFFSEHKNLEYFDGEIYADLLKRIAEERDIDTLFLGSTRRGRGLAPRIAQKLEASCITDATGFDSSLAFTRYTLGGNTVEKLTSLKSRTVVSFLPKTFEKTEGKKEGKTEEIVMEPEEPKTRLLERQPKATGQANIEEAERIIGVGRGIAKKEDLDMVQEFARLIGAEIGCTRPLAADLGWLTEDRVIGLSGKRSAPKLYMAIGVSGQIQHTVGIRDSKIIAVIDKNKDAPIFRIADYGIVGDLYECLPLLIKRLKGD